MVKLLVTGDPKVGKTSLIRALFYEYAKQNFFIKEDDNPSTTEFSQQKPLLQIWNTSHKAQDDSSVINFYKNATGILLVFSLEDLNSFQHLQGWMDEIRLYRRDKVPVILVGNKADLEERNVSWKDIKRFTTKYNLNYFQASSYNDSNYEMILTRIMKETMENKMSPADSSSERDETWLTEIKRIENMFNSELSIMKSEIEKLKQEQNLTKRNSVNELNCRVEDLENENKNQVILSKFEELSQKVDKNDEKVNEMLIYIEKELTLNQMNIMEEVNQKLQEFAENSVSIVQDKQQLMEAEFSRMIVDLNESIKKCIADTDNFYQNLREEMGGQKLDFKNQSLKVENSETKSCGYPNKNTHPLFRNANLSMDDAQSSSSVEEFRADDPSSPSEEDHYYSSPEDKENQPINLSTHHSSTSRNEKNNSKKQMKDNLLLSPQEEKNMENSMKEEFRKIWEALRSFAHETRDEFDKIKSENDTFINLNRMYNEAMNNKQKSIDIDKVAKNLQADFNNKISEFEKESSQVYANLKEMILSTREEMFEKIDSKIKNEELQQNGCENNDDNKVPTFLNPIEPIASEIHHGQGFISPNEDLSLAEFKLFEKKEEVRREEDEIKARITSLEKQQEEVISSSNEINRNLWSTVSLVGERVHRLELRIGVK